MKEEKAIKIINENEALVVGVTYNILFTNDLVCAAVIDMMSELRHSPLYRYRVKMLSSIVTQQRKAYESQLNGIISRSSDFFANANDAFCERVQPHVDHLYYAIKQEFDNHNQKESSLLARMELARTLASYACVQYEERIKMLCERDPQFRCFRTDYLCVSGIKTWMDKLMDVMPTTGVIDLNTPRVKMAINVLSNKLTDANNIAMAISA